WRAPDVIAPFREGPSAATPGLWYQIHPLLREGPWRVPVLLQPFPCQGSLFAPAHQLRFGGGEPCPAALLHAGDIASRQWQTVFASSQWLHSLLAQSSNRALSDSQ